MSINRPGIGRAGLAATAPGGSAPAGTFDATGRILSGSGVTPSSVVTIYVNGSQVGTTTANSGGAWTYTFGTAPAAGAVVGAAQVTAATVAPGGSTPPTALGPTTASFSLAAAAGSLIAAITGLSAGEAATGISPNDGRVVIAGGGTTLVVGMTASSAGAINYSVTTNLGRTLAVAVTAVAVTIPTNSVAPSISGAVALNAVLTANPGTWSGSPTGYNYAWYRNGTPITGAFASTYTCSVADMGRAAITVRASATNSAGTSGSIASASALAWRANATNTYSDNIFATSGSAYSGTSRRLHTSTVAFTQIRIMIPLWVFSAGGTILRNAIPESYQFAAAFKSSHYAGASSIPTNDRLQFTFNGSNVYTYTVGGTTQNFLYSDILTMPLQAANTPYEIFLTQECVAGQTAAVTNKMIIQAIPGSNYAFNRYQGFTQTSTIGSGHIASNFCMTGTSFGTLDSSAANGAASLIGVAAVLVPDGPTDRSFFIEGNSIEAGVNEGQGYTTTALGDAQGDALANRGSVSRMLSQLGYGQCNASKGSDREQYALLSQNQTVLSEFQSAVNPTWYVHRNPHNEFASLGGGGTPVATRAASTAYTSGTVVISFQSGSTYNYYLCVNPYVSGAPVSVTSSSSATGPQGTGANIADGGILWTYLGTRDFSTLSCDTAASTIGLKWQTQQLVLSRIPSIKFMAISEPPFTLSQIASTAAAYNSTTGVLTLTFANGTDMTQFYVGQACKLSGYATGINTSGSTGTNAVASVTAGSLQITFACTTGLGVTPTATGIVNTLWTTLNGQQPQSPDLVTTGARTWINRYLRAQPNPVLQIDALFDMGKYLESGNPVTPGTETGRFKVYVDGSSNPIPMGATFDGIHGSSLSYPDVVTQAMADSPFITALAA